MEKGRGRMAAQCRSPRCAAERRGFRRELDSWRHRLLHCVGFESILEGLYGPGLRRDLSLFDDCEPDDLTDWCVDDRCSFCSLRKEMVSDCAPTICSSHTTPTEELVSQGHLNTEKIECQAENYLNALFRKKDLPRNCDPNIPLVAQELMKKMIRQFAIEYVSKSGKLQENRNGSFESNLACNGVKMNQTSNSHQEEQDGPLDLTVTRTLKPNTRHGEGVLDLSTKKASVCSEKSSTLDPSYDTLVSRSYSFVDTNMLSQSDEESTLKKGTALNKVLDSLCKYHQQQVLKMLKFLVHERKVSSLTCSCNKLHINPEYRKRVNQVEGPLCSSIEHRHTRQCRFKNIKLNTALKPLSICIKDLRLSCKTVTLGSLKTVLNRGFCHNSNPQKCCGGSLQNCTKSSCVRRASCKPINSSEVSDVSKSINEYRRAQSPSPPPLSPVEAEQFENTEKTLGDISFFETSRLESNISQPPYLLPAEVHTIGSVSINDASNQPDVVFLPNELEYSQSSCSTEKFDKSENTVIFQDLLDRINEKLNSIETCHMDSSTNVLKPSNVQNPANDSEKFGEYIKSLVHNTEANDYSFMELLSQHEKSTERKTIQTRFRKRQKTFAIHSSSHSSVYRRQSLKIKRELANFDETFIRNNSVSERAMKSKKSENTTIGRRSKEGYIEFENTVLQDPQSNPNVPYQRNICLPLCQTQLSELPQHCVEANSSSMSCLEHSSGITFQHSNCTTAQGLKTNIHNHLDIARLEDVNAWKGDFSNIMERNNHNIACPVWHTIYQTNSVSAKKKKSSQTLENIKIAKNLEGERYTDMDLNVIAKSTNLQVIVERLEDTIHFANKRFNAHSLEEQFKVSGNLTKDTLECNKNTRVRELKCGVFEIECKKVNSKQKISSHSADKIKCGSPDYMAETDHESMGFPLSCDSICDGPNTRSKTCKAPSFCSYTSPIKLMFVSKVKSKKGFKYTLNSVDVSSKGNVLHNFERSSESKAKKTLEKVLNTRESTKECCKKGSTTNSNDTIAVEEGSRQSDNELSIIYAANGTEIKDCNKNEEIMNQSNSVEKAVPKRKPGRPKKIGPQIAKRIKRPIGRPPKPKVTITGKAGNRREPKSTESGTKSAATGNENDSSNANIRVTVFFGRSRRIRRQVSEDGNNAISIMTLNPTSCPYESKSPLYNSETDKILHESNTLPSLAAESMMLGCGYEHFRTIKDKTVLPHPNSDVMHSNGTKKLGRPPKVKISGISVTVKGVSSQERTVSLNDNLTSKDQETMLENNVSNEKANQHNKNYKMQGVQRRSPRYGSSNVGNLATTNKVIQLRQSVRAKTPSFNFLHAVASSNTFTYRRALVNTSNKQLSKAKQCNGKMNHPVTNPGFEHTPEIIKSCSTNNSGVGGEFGSSFEVSSDPIFQSDTSLKWWASSTSKETLLEDLNSRYEKMTQTWLQVDGNESKGHVSVKRDTTEKEYNLKVSNPMRTCLLECELSPVKMLFQKEIDMNDLCSWFMQTTETQSLTLVRKENVRSPHDVISNKKIKSGIQKPDLNSNASKKNCKKIALTSPSKNSAKLQTSSQVDRSHGFNNKNDIALVKLRTNKFHGLKHTNVKLQKRVGTRRTVNWKSKIRNSRYLCQIPKNTVDKRNNGVSLPHGKKALEPQKPCMHTDAHSTSKSTPRRMKLPNKSEQACTSNSCKRDEECKGNINQQYLGKALKQNEDCQNMRNHEDDKVCRVFLKKIKPTKMKVSCEQNNVLSLPEPIQSLRSQRLCVVEKKYWTLRSHSAQSSVEKKPRGLKNRSRVFPEPAMSTSYRSSRKSDKRLANNLDVLKRKTKGKRCSSPVETVDLKVAKRQKRQQCSSTKITQYYSNFQLGPITTFGLPMLEEFKRRNIEYSMTPFRMPVHGTTQTTKNNYS